MPRPKKSERLIAKAEAAMMAAIEVYNKADFLYREETFSILALNAWELLLKAKLVAERGEDLRCLCICEYRQTRDGSRSKRKYLRRNRTGNILTIGMVNVIKELEGPRKVQIGAAVKNNLDALTQVRDNAVHYFNASPELAKRVLEIGTASVKNFIVLAKRWFNRDLSSYNLYLMPIGFISKPTIASGIILFPDEGNLVRYLASLVRDTEEEESGELHVSLEIEVSLKRSQNLGTPSFALTNYTNDPTAPKIQLSEEDIRKGYPWDYQELTRRLKTRYSDFKLNNNFHHIRKPLMGDSRYVWSRYLDPGNPKSTKKDFYSSNVLNEFDKHYTRGNQSTA